MPRPPRTSRGDARALALARLISISGTVAAGIALAATLWDRTESAAWVAAGALSASLVAGVMTPLGGVLVDRLDRRRVMVASDVIAAACSGLLALLITVDAPPITYLLAAAGGAIAESPFVPASRAAIPNLVDAKDLPWANGLLGQVAGLSFAVGPLVGGTLTGLTSAAIAMTFNALTFLISAWLVVSIRRPMNTARADARERGALAAGFRFVWATPVIRAIITSSFLAFIGVGFVIAANPAFADREGAGAIGLGALWAGWGVGTVLGATYVPRLLTGTREVTVVVVGFTLQGLALGAAALLPFWWVVGGLILGGIGGGFADPARHTYIQRHVPDHFRGRVVAAMEAAGWLSFAVSLVVAGGLVDRLGTRPSYALASGLFAVGTATLITLVALARRPRLAM